MSYNCPHEVLCDSKRTCTKCSDYLLMRAKSHPTVTAPEGAALPYYCCKAEFGEHEPSCKNAERPVTPQAATQPPADAGEIARKQLDQSWVIFQTHPGTLLEGFAASMTDYAKPLVERMPCGHIAAMSIGDCMTPKCAMCELARAEARADSLNKKLEFIFGSVKHSQEISKCEVCAGIEESLVEEFPDWIAVVKQRDSLQRELGYVRDAYENHIGHVKSMDTDMRLAENKRDYLAETLGLMAKEIRTISKAEHVVSDMIGDKDDSLHVKMPTLSQWKSICWKAVKALAALGPVAGEGKEKAD